MIPYRSWLTRLLLWLLGEKDLPVSQAVNDDYVDDESNIHNQQLQNKRRRGTEDLEIKDDFTKEETTEKFEFLKEAFEELRGKMTRLEFEVEQLLDEKIEKEEEMKLQRVDLQ